MPLHVVDIGPPGPLIQVGIRVGARFDVAGRGGAPHSYTALIDTGASRSAISRRVIADVQPQRLGDAAIERAGAVADIGLIYDIRLKLDGHLTPGRWFDLEAVETAPATPGVDVLIGQDLLLQLTLLYNGPLGKLVLMY
jgi:predicted aspartyl protease